jgi:hypothetical protein
METPENQSKIVKRLIKSLPDVIFLFVVFACVFATIVLKFGEDLECKGLLIFLLAIFPLIFVSVWGFCVFKYIYTKRSYISFRASNKDIGSVCLLVEEAIDSNSENALMEFQKLLNKIPELLPKNSEDK